MPLSGRRRVARTLPRSVRIWRSLPPTLNRWRKQFGGIKQEDKREMRRLQKENRRLKKIVADQLLDIEGLKHIHRGNW